MGGEVILIVDDNPSNMKLVSFLLANRGYEVRAASNASEALASIGERRPALILMDLQMPGVDGFQLTQMLKADPTTSGIVVVAVTAYAMKGDEARARSAGCDGYLTKPIDTRALPGIVARFLSGED
jgi:two-component system cell cycle response regulator DivK